MELLGYTQSLSEGEKWKKFIFFFLKVSVLLIFWCAFTTYFIQKLLLTVGFEQSLSMPTSWSWRELCTPGGRFIYGFKSNLKKVFQLLLLGFGFGILYGHLKSAAWFLASKKAGGAVGQTKIKFELEDAYRQVGGIGIAIFFTMPFLTEHFHPFILAVVYGFTIAIYFALTQKPGSTIKDIYKSVLVIALLSFYILPMTEAFILIGTYLAVFYTINHLLLLRWIKSANEKLGNFY